jgi:hypothetical protein
MTPMASASLSGQGSPGIGHGDQPAGRAPGADGSPAPRIAGVVPGVHKQPRKSASGHHVSSLITVAAPGGLRSTARRLLPGANCPLTPARRPPVTWRALRGQAPSTGLPVRHHRPIHRRYRASQFSGSVYKGAWRTPARHNRGGPVAAGSRGRRLHIQPNTDTTDAQIIVYTDSSTSP